MSLRRQARALGLPLWRFLQIQRFAEQIAALEKTSAAKIAFKVVMKKPRRGRMTIAEERAAFAAAYYRDELIASEERESIRDHGEMPDAPEFPARPPRIVYPRSGRKYFRPEEGAQATPARRALAQWAALTGSGK